MSIWQRLFGRSMAAPRPGPGPTRPPAGIPVASIGTPPPAARPGPAIVPPEPGAGSRVLRAGMQGADVAKLQRIVGVPADGDFGPRTAGAVVHWQAEHGLVGDGVVGPATWLAMGIEGDAPAVFVAPPLPPGELSAQVLRVLVGLRLEGGAQCLDPAGWTAVLVPHMHAAGITSPLDLAGFLPNVVHETGGLRMLSECLHYTTPASICSTWPGRFPTYESAMPFKRNAYALAERVYGGRMGNGPEGSGDGFRFRGAGCYQTTGLANFIALVPIMGGPVERLPDKLRERDGAARAACLYWQQGPFRGMAARREWRAIRLTGNGGTIGMDHVLALTNQTLQLLEAADA